MDARARKSSRNRRRFARTSSKTAFASTLPSPQKSKTRPRQPSTTDCECVLFYLWPPRLRLSLFACLCIVRAGCRPVACGPHVSSAVGLRTLQDEYPFAVVSSNHEKKDGPEVVRGRTTRCGFVECEWSAGPALYLPVVAVALLCPGLTPTTTCRVVPQWRTRTTATLHCCGTCSSGTPPTCHYASVLSDLPTMTYPLVRAAVRRADPSLAHCLSMLTCCPPARRRCVRVGVCAATTCMTSWSKRQTSTTNSTGGGTLKCTRPGEKNE